MGFRVITGLTTILCVISNVYCYFLNEDRNTLGFNMQSHDQSPYYNFDLKTNNFMARSNVAKFQSHDRDQIVDSHFKILKSNNVIPGVPKQWKPQDRNRDTAHQEIKAERAADEGKVKTPPREGAPLTRNAKSKETEPKEPIKKSVPTIVDANRKNPKPYNSMKQQANIHINKNARAMDINQGNNLRRKGRISSDFRHNYAAMMVRPPVRYNILSKPDDPKPVKDRNILKKSRFIIDGDHKMFYGAGYGYRY